LPFCKKQVISMKRSRISQLAFAAGLVGLAAIAGCETSNYRGVSPTARDFDAPRGTRDYYVGMNFKFSVDRATEYRPAPSSGIVSSANENASASAEASNADSSD
jgi:hypothetical protein